MMGCSEPNWVLVRYGTKYVDLCKDEEYVRAAFEFEYGLNQVSYADKQHPRAKYDLPYE